MVTVDGSAPSGQVDRRFLSFGIDLARVTGGESWDPAGGVDRGAALGGSTVVEPYDFRRPLLAERTGAALRAAFLRLGGTASDRLAYAVAGEPP